MSHVCTNWSDPSQRFKCGAGIVVLLFTVGLLGCGGRDVGVRVGTPGPEPLTERPRDRASLPNADEPSSERETTIDSAPTTGPRELPPLDRASLPEVNPRWASPEWQAHHRRVMDELWATKLGQMYLDYLTDATDPMTIPGRATDLINRVFDDGDKLGSRLHVLRLFNQDIYARQKATPDTDRRKAIFDGMAESRKTAGQEELKRWISNGFAALAIGSIPFGSELVSGEVEKIYKIFSRRIQMRDVGDVKLNPAALTSKARVFKGYRFGRVIKTFLGSFGAASTFYFFYYDWLPGWKKNHKYDPLLNSKDHLLQDASS